MLKLAVAILLIAGVFAVSPSFAAKASGIGAGCTLNPFTHTMRCVQF